MEIVYQARMFSEGRTKPILSGKSYNISWGIHRVFSKAISRLFQEYYVALLISGKSVEESNLDHSKIAKILI